MNRAYVAEILRRMDAASLERFGTDLDVRATREVELDPDGVAEATEALHVFLHRLDELALARPTEDSITFTAATLFFHVPRSASLGHEGSSHERRSGRQSAPDVPAVPSDSSSRDSSRTSATGSR